MGLARTAAGDEARRGDPALKVILVFFLLGPAVGALLAGAIEFALCSQEDVAQGVDVFGMVATIGFLCALVPAALAGWTMSGLSGRVEMPVAWVALGVLVGGLVSGLACAAVIVMLDAGVHGSLRLSSNLTGELLFCLLFAAHGAVAGGVCAAATIRGRPEPRPAPQKPLRRDPLAALNVGDA